MLGEMGDGCSLSEVFVPSDAFNKSMKEYTMFTENISQEILCIHESLIKECFKILEVK